MSNSLSFPSFGILRKLANKDHPNSDPVLFSRSFQAVEHIIVYMKQISVLDNPQKEICILLFQLIRVLAPYPKIAEPLETQDVMSCLNCLG